MDANFLFATTLATLLATSSAGHAMSVDHQEFDATLQAPFRADSSGGRDLTLRFAQQAGRVRWRLDLMASSKDSVLRRWHGERLLGDATQSATITLRWQADPATPAGLYRLRLRASLDGAQHSEQIWPVAVGPAPPAFAPAITEPPPEAAGYDIYLGNLHSQTGHSDGGGALGQCNGAQAPQSAPLGPSDAYAYALAHRLDFLMTSEHNHLYDGHNGTNADADPAAVRALFHNGRHQADTWNLAHRRLLALYGQEWGVIERGGHLNILNGGALLGWERNAQGALLADIETPKNDYAALYTLMRGRGWLGQFNHPQRGQFAIDGKPLAWTADGDQAMLLCEVVNSHAFSNSADESEARRSNFEAGCNALLEAGYHLGFSSNQDNHCANWGASDTNRTAVLLPKGMPLTAENFLDALTARRVYATMDKQAQLIFTANGHVMGERFANRGKLTLTAGYASKNGRVAAGVTIFHGVPGRNGTVGILSNKSRSVVTPGPGEHFYYARVIQDDGKMLWSAPIWVTQSPR
jgi:hypothetical protein